MIDKEYVTYMNNDKCFPDYKSAYFNGQHFGEKKVWYIFTPTWIKCRNVSELEYQMKKYFNKVANCDYFNINDKTCITQLKMEI